MSKPRKKRINNANYIAELRCIPDTEDKAYSVDVTIWEAAEFGDAGGPTHFQINTITQTEDEAIFVTGFIKWDHCSNWSFNTADCMAHACSRNDLLAIGDILAKCFDAAKEMIPETWATYASDEVKP